MLLATASAIAQPLTSKQKDSVDSLFANWDSQKKPGIAVAIVKDGNEIYSKTVGMSDVAGGIKANDRTSFWIASVSKQFTAIGITALEQKGALSLTDPISKYLPELSHLPSIQIKHLLHHTSGLRDGFTLVGMTLKGEKHYDPKSVFDMIKMQKALNFQPGTRHEYVNSNYVILALIAERVSKKSFADFMQSEVFGKLGLSDSRIFNNDKKSPDAVGHYNSVGKYKKNKRFIPAIGSLV
jgi:CubicO group peptidase (beta-lactamase class C family)